MLSPAPLLRSPVRRDKDRERDRDRDRGYSQRDRYYSAHSFTTSIFIII